MPMPKSNRFCSVDGCGRKHQSRGLCKGHWQRWRRYGDVRAHVPLEMGNLYFLREVALTDERDECVIWPFNTGSFGYGSVHIGGKHLNAHHYVCQLAHGERPSDRHVAAHNCGNPACVNPHHIRWATQAANMKDMIVHGTVRRGDNHRSVKLSDHEVSEIRSLAGSIRQSEIARRFCVSPSTISGIISGKHRRAPASEAIKDKLAAFNQFTVDGPNGPELSEVLARQVAQPNWAGLGLGSAEEAEGRN